MIVKAWVNIMLERQLPISILGCSFLLIAIVPTSAHAQQVTAQNYRAYAACREVVVSGKIFSTFGEGRCPPQAQRNNPQLSMNDPNAGKMAVANAIGSMQQSLVGFARGLAAAMYQKSEQILNNYVMDFDGVDQKASRPLFEAANKVLMESRSPIILQSGEVFIEESQGFYSECIFPTVDYEKKYNGWIAKVVAGSPSCRIEKDDGGFAPSYVNGVNPNSKGQPSLASMQYVSENDGSYSICLKQMGLKYGCAKPVPFENVKRGTGFVHVQNQKRPLARVVSISLDKIEIEIYRYDGNKSSSSERVSFPIAVGGIIEILGSKFDVIEADDRSVVVKVQAQ
jgi:hypothetical protein